VPRAKYTKPPDFPAIERTRRSTFHFRKDQWNKLARLLPYKLADLTAAPLDSMTPLPEQVRTIADCIIEATENEINSHLTAISSVTVSHINPAAVLAAVRLLRRALKPFVSGSVDIETADIVPAELDVKLAAREQELTDMRLPSARQRFLALLCQRIEITVRHWASSNREQVNRSEMLRYIDAALTFARISHPDVGKHRARLAALVFPPQLHSPHSAGQNRP
jgi:hypothetical protein